jgi:hypothetical protein
MGFLDHVLYRRGSVTREVPFGNSKMPTLERKKCAASGSVAQTFYTMSPHLFDFMRQQQNPQSNIAGRAGANKNGAELRCGLNHIFGVYA